MGRRLRRGSFEVELLERRELLATVQNFDVPGTGTQFAPLQAGNAPGPAVIQLSPTNGVMQLTSGLASTPNQDNSISFVTSDVGTFNEVDASFVFRISPGPSGGRGDGMSFALLNTANYGTSGVAQSILPEKGLFNGSLGIGFDTFQSPSDSSDNSVVVSLNAAAVQSFDIPKTTLDLASGAFISTQVTVNFVNSTVNVVLTPTGGAPVTVVNNLTVPGLVPYQSRVNYSARAVDSLATTLLDNVNVQFVGLRQPGTVSFGSATYTVLENQSVALIDVIRTGGTAGSISIGFVAADGTARHAVNYVAVSGTVTFAEGDSIQTIVVPIIDDQVFSSNKTVDLYLSNPTLTAPLGSPIRATLTIVNTDPDLPPPTVSRKVQPVYAPRTRRVVAFRLTFSRTMDSTSAQNTQNYEILIPPARKNGARRTVPISQAVLDPGGQIVTLVRADLGRMHLARQVQIRVNGKPPAGLKDTSGVFLAGMNGQAGTDAVLSVSV